MDYYKILGVGKTSTPDEIKKSFRALALKYHPDKNPTKEAAVRIREITVAYEILMDVEKRKRYDKSGSADPVVILSKKQKYRLEQKISTGDLADIYTATRLSDNVPVVLKITRDPGDNDLVENEAKILNEIFPPKAKEEKHLRWLPRILESFKLDDGKRHSVNILGFLDNYYNLVQVRDKYPELMMEHGVWMLNRILEGLDFIHLGKGYVHGAIVPAHILIQPESHGAKIIDWSYAVKSGERIKAISPAWKDFYPPEVFAKGPATAATDIYMAAKTAIYVLGGDINNDTLPSRVPSYLIKILKGCLVKEPRLRWNDAWTFHEEFKEFMAKNYGPKKFMPFTMKN